jgi:carboxypeptidase C (cathepsin A)
MKIIITEKQLSEIRKHSQYDDKEAEEIFDTYKDVVNKFIDRKLKAYGENDDKVELYDKDKNVMIRYRKVSRSLFYDWGLIEDGEKLMPNLKWISNGKYFVEYSFSKLFPDYYVKSVSGAHIV